MNSPGTNLDDVWDKNFKSYFSVDQIPEISFSYGPYPSPACEVPNLPLPPMRLNPKDELIRKIMNDPALSDSYKQKLIDAINQAQVYAGTGPVVPPPPPVINPNRPSAGGGNGGIIFPDGSSNPTGGGSIGGVITIDDDGVHGAIYINPYQTANELAQQLLPLLAPPVPSSSCDATPAGDPSSPGTPTPTTPALLPKPGTPQTPQLPTRPSTGGGGNNPGGGGGGRKPGANNNGIGPVSLP